MEYSITSKIENAMEKGKDISKEEYEELIDAIMEAGKNDSPDRGIKHRYEAQAFVNGLIGMEFDFYPSDVRNR